MICAHRTLLHFNLDARDGYDDFRLRKIDNQCCPHPFHSWWIAMDEQDLSWRKPFRVVDQRFARCVRAKLKLFDIATHALWGFARIECYFPIRLRISQKTSGRFTIGEANKE